MLQVGSCGQAKTPRAQGRPEMRRSDLRGCDEGSCGGRLESRLGLARSPARTPPISKESLGVAQVGNSEQRDESSEACQLEAEQMRGDDRERGKRQKSFLSSADFTCRGRGRSDLLASELRPA